MSDFQSIKEAFFDEHKRFEKDCFKIWEVPFEGYVIRVQNAFSEEKLWVDGKLVAHKKRKNWWTYLKPSQTLEATFTDRDGKPAHLRVRLHGLVAVKCEISVNGKVIFQDRHVIPWR